MIRLTDTAIEHLRNLVEERGGEKGLRLFVERGGCAGLQYGMNLDAPHEGDQVFEQQGVQLIVDAESVAFLTGATVDYCEDLTGTGFRIHNPNAVRSCGCGTSFETAAADAENAAQA